MKRRDCVKLLAAAALGPAWLRRAFADVTVHGAPAKPLDGPTLVLVIPRDEGGKWERGRAFGELLELGDDHDLAPLALVDVVARPAASFGVEGEPLMLYVDNKARLLDGKLGQYPLAGDDVLERPSWRRRMDLITRERIALLSGLIRDALAPLRARDGRSDGTLAAVARARYVERPPPGAHWASAGSCGLTVEDAPELSEQVDCGMGSISAGSRRFLYFFTRAQR